MAQGACNFNDHIDEKALSCWHFKNEIGCVLVAVVIFPPWLHFFSPFFFPKWFVLLPRLEGAVSDLSPGAMPWQAGEVAVMEGRMKIAW